MEWESPWAFIIQHAWQGTVLFMALHFIIYQVSTRWFDDLWGGR